MNHSLTMFSVKLSSCFYCLFSAVMLLAACRSRPTLFKKISSGHSGIHFNNQVIENDSINPIDMEFLYHGGGVATGDFNRDGLPDLYFTGSMVPNRLYLNKGDFRFQDITEESGTSGNGRWSTGVAVVDINNDGWPDIYVCTSINKDASQRKNLLYVNQGPDKNGVPVFKEMADEYGLADTSYAVQVAFFDYDNDGDLDMYLVTTRMIQRNAVQFNNNNSDTSSMEIDKLYRNDWNDSLHHPVFADVSAQAGIRETGYGMGVVITDINQDGWKDIYVSNDFVGSDLLYINNHDGTFSEQLSRYFKHTSQNAMGLDIADINNDGLDDIFTVDMDPADNYRKKKNMNRNNYYVFLAMISQRYMLQYVRNTLQLNQGFRKDPHDSTVRPLFSEIGYYAGIAET
ncbi:MAG TPA: VCBS repeat-containing protein, partial [Puia sp.]|nr:VCBS repeat-containing protein [Puia sp.]